MIIWDDPKLEGYAYQTEFSYQMNHLSKKKWYFINITLGTVLGIVMALLLFVVSSEVLSDPARMVLAIVIGGGGTKYLETRAERSSKISQLAMALTFILGMVFYALHLLLGK